MAVTIADTCFDFHDYDARGDTLFLSVEEPGGQAPARSCETPEGHVIEYDEQGAVRSIELLNARWLLERDGKLRVTLPGRPAFADSRELRAVLASHSGLPG
jgi:uncharacterized protein YuzE